MVKCGFDNWHQKDMYFKEMKLHAQMFLTIIGSMIKAIEDLIYDH